MITKPTLVIYCFGAKETPSNPQVAANARNYLEKLWQACTQLNMQSPLPHSTFSTQFPDSVNANDSAFGILAAKTDLNRSEDYQAFLFDYHDTLGFVATLESNGNESLTQWQALFAEWTRVVGESQPPQGVMEETYLFSALQDRDTLSTSNSDADRAAETMSNLGRQVIDALPGCKNARWRAGRAYVTAEGYHIWEGEQFTSRRIIGLLAPREKENELFQWTVWPQSPDLAPFAHYLMHAAKLRFAEHIFERDLPGIENAARPLDNKLKRLIPLYRRSEDPAWDLDELTRAHNQLIDEQTRNFILLFDITTLKELQLTAQIALRNMKKFVPAKHPGGFRCEGGLFEDDRLRSVRFVEQIKIQLGYLTALRQRAQEGHKMAGRLLEQESQRTARRLNSLVLLQGTLLGSLTVGLLMLPAFDVFRESRELIWALTGLLMSTALAVPPLFARWPETYKWGDSLVGGLFCAALVFFTVNLWEQLQLPSFKVPRDTYIAFRVLSPVAGFLVGSYAVRWGEKLKPQLRRKLRQPHEVPSKLD